MLKDRKTSKWEKDVTEPILETCNMAYDMSGLKVAYQRWNGTPAARLTKEMSSTAGRKADRFRKVALVSSETLPMSSE